MPQLSLQQNSPSPQTDGPHCSPGGVGEQNSRVHPWPSGTHRLQLSLQQYSPGPQIALIARLTETEIFGARRSHRDAESAALRTAFGPFQAEHGGTRIDILGDTDTRAVRATRVRVTSIAGVDALVPVRALDSRDATAHAAWLPNLGPGSAVRKHRSKRSHDESAQHLPPRTSLCDAPRPLVKSLRCPSSTPPASIQNRAFVFILERVTKACGYRFFQIPSRHER